jgi:predicted nucleic-acid-binding protein
MIAVDTNIVLRRLLQDDKAQAAKANDLFDGADAVLITDVVLAETAWTLSGRRYGLTREQIVVALTSLFQERTARFESVDAAWKALRDYAEATPIKRGGNVHIAGFADAMIVRKATEVMANAGEARPVTYTFDIGAQHLPGASSP